MNKSFIEIFHPEIPSSQASVSEKAFVVVWEAKGWKRAGSESPQPEEGTPGYTSPESPSYDSDEYITINDPEED